MQSSADLGLGATPPRTPSDRDLISRFLDTRDESAFAQIVTRHSRLVMSVALHTLRDPHAAEDAFQAAFLVLARSARRIRNRDSLASWLHGTTFRVSQRLLRTRLRRKEQELPSVELSAPWDTPPRPDEQAALDEELARLSEGLRAPLVLHYLEGRTVHEIATELKMTQAAIEGRLKRGKKTLRKRLLKRGVLLSSAAFGAGLTVPVEAGVAAGLVTATIAACLKTTAATSLTPIAASTIQQIALQETAAMARIALLKTALVCGGVAGAIGLIGAGAGAGADGTPETALVHTGGRADSAGTGDSRSESPVSAISPTPIIHTALAQASETPNILVQSGGTRLTADRLEIATREEGATDKGPLSLTEQTLREEIAKKNEAMLQLELRALQAQVQKRPEDSTAGANNATPSAPENKIISPPDAVTTPSVRAHIEDALKQPAQLQFTGQTLEEALHYVAAHYKMPIVAEFGAIQQAGASKDVEVFAGVKGIPLAEALQVVLGSVKGGGLIAEVQDDGLHIRPRREKKGLSTLVNDQTSLGAASPLNASLLPPGEPSAASTNPNFPEFAMRGMTDASLKSLQEQVDQLRTIVEAQKALIEKTRGTPVEEVELPRKTAARPPESKTSDPFSNLEKLVQPIRDFRTESASESRFRERLDEPTILEFHGQTLKEVIAFLSSERAMPIRLDSPTLTAAGVSEDTEINLMVSDVSLRSALNLLFKDVGGTTLDYVFENEVIVVTTKEKADETLQTVVYDLSKLQSDAGHLDPELITTILEKTVEPLSWESAGGQGSIFTLGDKLLINTSRRLHEKAGETLDLLQRSTTTK
ncbi:ECF RNA polymerase sigma factor SigE [Caulifigura coniformis]|uniref:ECF RNA polymerase sigma factor SigE n=1 Tax=Caulifigura coniformis TaxID=2527983 RepID=A0A517S8C1_9PLAN|nr:sigma-70 family RNA polymerase sigma factor [Caulifigura coniformis]QDT52374.1 ECF RNA polymerase sigma factor SigE [Caulifigura coniformis]